MDANAVSIKEQAHQAACSGDLQTLQVLFQEHRDELITPDETCRTLMHSAAIGGDMGTIKWLLAEGFDINARGIDGGSPLFEAVYRKNEGAVRLLKSHGAHLFLPKGHKKVSYFAFTFAFLGLAIMAFIIARGNLTIGRCFCLMLAGIFFVTGLMEGVNGLRGKQTMLNE